MEIHQAAYLQSAVKIDGLPKESFPEYAFAGRSNVGKSSVINMICGMKKLAITSSKPGRTQAINHFLINKNWYLVDLPGYGFAKVSKSSREKWQKLMKRYVVERKNLVAVFLLIDIRVPIMESDLGFIQLLGEKEVPFNLVFTKADQIKQTEIHSQVTAYEEKLLETWESLPPIIISSVKKGQGKNEILEYIEKNNEVFRQQALPE